MIKIIEGIKSPRPKGPFFLFEKGGEKIIMAERINPCGNPDCICNCKDCPWMVVFPEPVRINWPLKLDVDKIRQRSRRSSISIGGQEKEPGKKDSK
jgi:hypothetical protein